MSDLKSKINDILNTVRGRENLVAALFALATGNAPAEKTYDPWCKHIVWDGGWIMIDPVKDSEMDVPILDDFDICPMKGCRKERPA